MKRNYTPISRLLTALVMLFMVSALTLLGQAPGTFNYQAVLRDAEGEPRAGTNVAIELEIHQATSTGTVVYSEIHNTTTDAFGLVTLEVGSVSPGSFATIDWAAGPYFVEVSVDGTSMGVSQLLAVPYAMHANSVESIEIFGTEAAFAGWDKNEADDFDGAFGSLSGIPAGLADGDDNTQLNEGQVEAFIDGNETSFDGWDKDASDDIAIASPQDGDIIYYRSGGWTRLPRGNNGEALYMDGGLPDWRSYSDVGVQSYFQFVTYHSSSVNPIAHGFIYPDASIQSGTGNFTCSWNASLERYEITITGHSYLFRNYTTIVTLCGSEGDGAGVTTNSVGGDLLIYIRR